MPLLRGPVAALMTGALERQAPRMARRAVPDDSPRDSPVGRWYPRWVAFVVDEPRPPKVRSQSLPLTGARRCSRRRARVSLKGRDGDRPRRTRAPVGDDGRTLAAPSPTVGQAIPFAARGGPTPIGLATRAGPETRVSGRTDAGASSPAHNSVELRGGCSLSCGGTAALSSERPTRDRRFVG
jgi:hypothetical protein